MAPVIETRNLTKSFGKIIAVDGLDITVEQGDLFGFLGPNGAGKSTTIRMLLALVRPAIGRALVFGRDVWADKREALRNVGALVETPSFYKFLTGRENLEVLGRATGGVNMTEIDRVLEMVGLTSRAGDKVGAYSHGMRQRLGIAQALMGEPSLVILDEPTTGLDPEGMKEVRELILSLKESASVTVFLSSHLLHEVEQICDKVAIINRGKVLAQGNVRDMLDGANRFEIETSKPMEMAAALRQIDWVKIDNMSGEVLTVTAPRDKAAELNRLLVQKGFDVSAFVPRNHTLEEVYLELTGAEEENGGTDPA